MTEEVPLPPNAVTASPVGLLRAFEDFVGLRQGTSQLLRALLARPGSRARKPYRGARAGPNSGG
jgi:hypothetical protein